jgi:hypothetical protein
MPDHRCPGAGCSAEVPADRLACPRHWYALPAPLRAAIWRAWDNGAGAGSPAHTAAIAAALRLLEAER